MGEVRQGIDKRMRKRRGAGGNEVRNNQVRLTVKENKLV